MRGPCSRRWRNTTNASAGGAAPEARALATVAASKARVKHPLSTGESFFFAGLRIDALLNQPIDRIAERADLLLGFRFRYQTDDGLRVGAAHVQPAARKQNLHPVGQINLR